MTRQEKYENLIADLSQLGSVAIAFSGGVDSTFLLAAAIDAVGERVLAVIGKSPTYPQREYEHALVLADKLGARYRVVETDELSNPDFSSNPPHRCFVCKTTLFRAVRKIADEEGMRHILEGSNADDCKDFRPGMRAARELGVLAPLAEHDLSKDEIRALSREMGLPTWNKPAFACLSSRVPYGQEINLERLGRIELSEYAIRDLGFEQLRVRDHGDIARVEVAAEEIERLASPKIRDQVVDALRRAGYDFVCLDLEGYRTGSMNAALSGQARADAMSKTLAGQRG